MVSKKSTVATYLDNNTNSVRTIEPAIMRREKKEPLWNMIKKTILVPNTTASLQTTVTAEYNSVQLLFIYVQT
jgi:hypothetical protein